MIRRISLLLPLLFLSACSATSLSGTYPFPTSLPKEELMEKNYDALKHDLSPVPGYQFTMEVPKGWRTLDVRLEARPEKGQLGDIAIFREPGQWMNDETAPIAGEISVNVVNVEDDKMTPADWLEKMLNTNLKGGFTVLNKRITPSSAGEVPDILIRYKDKTDTLISRMMAIRKGNDMFIVTCSDTAEGYDHNAEACNVAVSTFQLIKKK